MTHHDTLTADTYKGRRRIRRMIGIPADECLTRDQVARAQELARKNEWKQMQVWPKPRKAKK